MSGDSMNDSMLTCAQNILNLTDDLSSGDLFSGADDMPFSCLCTDDFNSGEVSSRNFWSIDEDLKAVPVITTVVFILFLIALIWNCFIIITYLVKRELLKEPGNIFLFNIAVSDLLIALSTMLFSFVTLAAEEFVFGNSDAVRCGLCNFAGTFFMMLILFSTFVLAALSIDRFIHLAKPLSYSRIMKPWRAWLIIVILWVLALICGVLPVGGYGQHEFNRNFGACIPRFSGVNTRTGLNNRVYIFTIFVVAMIPIITLIITNVGTYRLVSKFLKRNFRRKTIYRKDTDADSRRASKKHRMQQKQLVRVFSALLISTAISWTPVIIVVLCIIFIDPRLIPEEIFIFGWICYITNPVFHPIVESFFVRDLRYQVKRARRTIKKRATTIFRKSTQFFNSQALDEANAAMEREESTMANHSTCNETTVSRMTPSPSPEVVRPTATKKKFKKKITFSDDLPSPGTIDVELKAFRKSNITTPPPIAEVEMEIEEGEPETQFSAPNGWIHSPNTPNSDTTENSNSRDSEGPHSPTVPNSTAADHDDFKDRDAQEREVVSPADREEVSSPISDGGSLDVPTVVSSVEVSVNGVSNSHDQ